MKNDNEIFELINKEHLRQKNGIELIASENFVSPNVMKATGSCLTNKYAEGYPRKRYYGGCEIVDQVEQVAIDRAKELFGVEYVNVQPHSGSQANSAVMLSCLNAGDTILGFNLAHGGHLTHGSPVNFSGKLYRTSFYNVDKETGLIDYKMLEEVAQKEKPKMIICGGSAYSRDWDYKKFREVADSISAILLADIAHPAGLIAAKLLNNPADYCHILTTTTHKTLRGPRGGMILWNNPDYTRKFNSGIFPGTQGGPLMNIIAAKAQCYMEANTEEFRDYSAQVIKNAQAMARQLEQYGIEVLTGGTDSHILLIDLRDSKYSGRQAADLLEENGITVNKNGVPNDPRNFVETSGIRIGTAAETTKGHKEYWFRELAQKIANLLRE